MPDEPEISGAIPTKIHLTCHQTWNKRLFSVAAMNNGFIHRWNE
jgi:hypothetical protein